MTDMKRLAMNSMILSFLLLLGLPAGTRALEGEGGAELKDLQRIEAAFMAGLGRAVTPLETYECLRFRNSELGRLLERNYAATLAWLAGRRDIVDALEQDQARWLTELALARSTWSDSVDESIASQATISTMLLERIRLFAAITTDSAFKEYAY